MSKNNEKVSSNVGIVSLKDCFASETFRVAMEKLNLSLPESSEKKIATLIGTPVAPIQNNSKPPKKNHLGGLKTQG